LQQLQFFYLVVGLEAIIVLVANLVKYGSKSGINFPGVMGEASKSV